MSCVKMMMLILINACFINVYGLKITYLQRTKPQYPYTPRNGVFSGGKWESFNYDWAFKKDGGGEINVYAKGEDLFVGIFDRRDVQTNQFRYALIIAGWGNSYVKLYENGDFSKVIGGFPIHVNPNVFNKYKIFFDQDNREVSLHLNGDLVGKIRVGLWKARRAKYYSFSQWGSSVVIDNIPKDCRVMVPEYPRNGVFTGGSWQCFSQTRVLSKPGKVYFYAKGGDIYIGFFDKERKNTVNFNYAIIISGWGNTVTKVFKNGNFQRSIGEFPTKLNTVAYNRYEVEFNDETHSISLWANGDFIGKVTDPEWSATYPLFYSFSQWANSVVINNLPNDKVPSSPYIPKSGVFFGGDWEYFNNDWSFNKKGSGVLEFTARGGDVYIGFFEEKGKFTTNFRYSLILNGWSNSRTNVYKNGTFSKIVSGFNDKVDDLYSYIRYKIIFDGQKKTISVYRDNKFAGKYTDQDWKGSKVKYISFSQWGNYVFIKDISVDGKNFQPEKLSK